MDRLTAIKTRVDAGLTPNLTTAGWLIGEIEGLRAISHADQVVIQRLRREVDHWVAIADEAQTKLAQANQRAASRGGRVPR